MNSQVIKPRMMLAISSQSPRAEVLLNATSRLASELQAEWYVVHVRQPPTLHYRMPATRHPVPERDLDCAERLGARVMVESLRGSVASTLTALARTMGIRYFVTGRSKHSIFRLRWRPTLMEEVQRGLPGAILLIV